LKFEFTQSLNVLTIGNATDPLYPLILRIIRCLVILAVRAWFGVFYKYRITMRECLKGSQGKRVNILSFRDLNLKHLSTIKIWDIKDGV
jgi:ABC-type anion transport system duplicated permease subunit